MKVVVNAIPTAPGGGLSVLLGLLEGWQELGADVQPTILAAHPQTLQTLQDRGWGACVHRVSPQVTARASVVCSGWARYLHPASLLNAIAAYRWQRNQLGAYLQSYRPDILLTNSYYIPKAPCPQVVHHNNLWLLYSRHLLAYALHGPHVFVLARGAREALVRAQANIFSSENQRRWAEQINPASRPRNRVVYNGMSSDFRQLAGQHTRCPAFTGKLCAVQTPARYKGNYELLQALRRLLDLAPEVAWHLKVAGGGDWSGVRKRAARLGIADRVDALGALNLAQVAELFRDSDCLVFPSNFEAFGMPVLEAMSQGCPVVAVNATAVPEVAGSAALLVPRRDPELLARAVLSVYRDAALRQRLSEAGPIRAADFSWARSAREFCRVFESVLNGRVTPEPTP